MGALSKRDSNFASSGFLGTSRFFPPLYNSGHATCDHSSFTCNRFHGLLPQLRDLIVLKKQFLQASELCKCFGCHFFYATVWQVQTNQLWNHFKSVGFHLLQLIVVQMQNSKVGNIWKYKQKYADVIIWLLIFNIFIFFRHTPQVHVHYIHRIFTPM